MFLKCFKERIHMKRITKKLPVYFLSLAFVLLKFSITSYANEQVENYIMEESLQEGDERTSFLISVKKFGDSDGFKWTYNGKDYSLTVTGEDRGINTLPSTLPEAILSNTKKIVFKDCVVVGGSMSYMFAGLRENLISVDMSGLDTSNVTDMSNMFYWCSNLKSVNMSGLDTSNVTDMSDMFSWCDSLTSVNLCGLDTSNVKDMSYMFASCDNLVKVDMSTLDTSKVEDMSNMFSGCDNLTSVDLSSLDTSSVKDMSNMFSGCDSLTGVDLSEEDTSNVEEVSDTTEVSDLFSGMKESVTNVPNLTNLNNTTSVDMSNLDTSNVEDMSSLFSGCKSLTSVDMSGLNVLNVIDMSYMFSGCSSLTSVDMSDMDASKVLDMSQMLSGCDSLEYIGVPKAMAAGVSFALPTTFEDAQKSTVNEITSAHCNKTWAKNYDTREYSIIYNLNGGTNNSNNPKNYTRHSKTITFRKPVREGYVFKGWYSDEKFTQKVTKIKMGSTGTVELHAKWKIKTYDITYKLSGGKNNAKNPADYKITTKTIKLLKPKKKGYTFKGWYEDKEFNEKVTEIKKGSTGDKILYAKWKAKKYDITYELDGGENDSKNPKSYSVESSTITLENPTKAGYRFEGWYSNNQYSKRVTEIKSGSTGDKALFAKWGVIKYDIAFDGNGSTSGSMNIQSDCKHGSDYSLSQNVFQRTGYTFAGWNTRADGSGRTYGDKSVVRNLTDSDGDTITLYAQWTLDEYSITYNLNEGVNSNENPTTYTITTETISLKNPTRTGYTFEGWYNDANFTEKVTSIKTGSSGNQILYAKWSVSKYSIAFNGNGATSGSMPTQSNYNYGSSYTLNANVFQRTGYTFNGWNTKADGSGTAYADKATVSNLASNNESSVTLYAQWKVNSYSITYYLNGGVNSNENPGTYAMTTETITLKDPARTGYTFGGWYSNTNYTVKVTVINAGSTGNRVLYAKWIPVTYSITYKLNGGTNSSMNPSGYNVTTATIELQNPTKEGYTFKGWYRDKEYTQKVTKIKKGSTGNKTFYAKWKKK